MQDNLWQPISTIPKRGIGTYRTSYLIRWPTEDGHAYDVVSYATLSRSWFSEITDRDWLSFTHEEGIEWMLIPGQPS